jgi:hypothetical protein
LNERQKITIAILVPVIVILFTLSVSFPGSHKWSSNDWKSIFLSLSISFIVIVIYEWFWLKERKEKKDEKDVKSSKSKKVGITGEIESVKEDKRKVTIGQEIYRVIALLIIGSIFAIHREVEQHQGQYPVLEVILKYFTYAIYVLLLSCLIGGVAWFVTYIWSKTWADIKSSSLNFLKQEMAGHSVAGNIIGIIIGIAIVIYTLYILYIVLLTIL